MNVDSFFVGSQIAVMSASFVICVCGVFWIYCRINAKPKAIEEQNNVLLMKLAQSMVHLTDSTVRGNELHEQELNHRIDLMQTLHKVVKEIQNNSEQLKNYGRRCDEAHAMFRNLISTRV